MKRTLAILLALLTALAPCALAEMPALEYADEQVLRLVYNLEATSLSPFSSSGGATGWQAITNCIEGLVTADEYGMIIPGLAASWDVSQDESVYTFHLRDGLQWVDCEGNPVAPITASDFVAVAQYSCDPRNAASSATPYEQYIAGAEALLKGETADFDQLGFKALDDLTLQLTLKEPVPNFLPLVSAYIAAYGPLLAQLGAGYGVDSESMYYSGAYYLQEFQPQYRRVYKKNPYYHGAAQVYIEKVVMTYNAEAQTLAPQLFMRGEADAAKINADVLTEWKANKDTADIVLPGRPDPVYMYFYAFNYHPQFDAEYEPENWKLAVNNEHFRQSLYWGLNRLKALLVQDPYNPQLMQTNTLVPKGWCDVDGVDYTQIEPLKAIADRPENSFDEVKALAHKTLATEELKAVGATFPVKMLMPYNPGVKAWEMEVQVVKQQLTQLLGADYIDCVLVAGPTTGFLDAYRRSGKYAFMKLNNGSGYKDPISRIPPFDRDNNFTFLDKAVGDELEPLVRQYYALTDAARKVMTQSMARYQAFAEAEALLLSHALVIPFSTDTEGYFVSRYNPFERPHSSDNLWRGMRVLKQPLTEAQYAALQQAWQAEREARLLAQTVTE